MGKTFTALYDGQALIPDEPLDLNDLKPNSRCLITIESASELGMKASPMDAPDVRERPLQILKDRLSDDPTITPSVETRSKRSPMELLEEIWRMQEERGHQPPTKEAVDSYLRVERESWER